MRYVTAIVITAALTLAASAAVAGSKKHHLRHAAYPRGPAVVAPAPPRMFEARPGVFISTYGCIQDEGYGRWLYCGQGRS